MSDITDTFSLIFSLIQIMQGLRGATTPEKKYDFTKSALDTVDPLYTILRNAKNDHDFLETLSSLTDQLDKYLDLNHSTSSRDNSRILVMAQNIQREAKKYPYGFARKFKALDGRNFDNADLPSDIKQALFCLFESLELYASGMPELETHSKNLQNFVHNRNFGVEFDSLASVFHHQVVDCRNAADKVIFHLVPILGHFHNEMKRAFHG